jgi:cytochrome c553
MKYYLLGLTILLLGACTSQGDKQAQATKVQPQTQVQNATAPEKVQICLACHGVDGVHGKVGVPPLGGRTYNDLVNAMHDVREAYSPQPLLGHFLSDDDIKEVALYFSGLK